MIVAVHTTVANREEAKRIAQAVIGERLAACAHISDIESIYRWQGMVQNDAECQLSFTTTEVRREAVETVIRRHHSYELPAIHAIELIVSGAEYRRWIEENSSGQSG